jgi:hypothetical protein
VIDLVIQELVKGALEERLRAYTTTAAADMVWSPPVYPLFSVCGGLLRVTV